MKGQLMAFSGALVLMDIFKIYSGIKMEKGSRKELTFILDAQENRRNYPFVPKGSTYFAG